MVAEKPANTLNGKWFAAAGGQGGPVCSPAIVTPPKSLTKSPPDEKHDEISATILPGNMHDQTHLAGARPTNGRRRYISSDMRAAHINVKRSATN